MAKRIVKTKYGPVLMGIGKAHANEHAQLVFEREFLKIIEEEEYDFFIDVGAAWGYHTIPAANHTKKVYAFEPSSIRFVMLEYNIEELGLENVMISSDAVGTSKIDIFSGRGMLGPQTGIRSKKASVKWIPLEVVAKPHITRGERGVIKIDVEGNELDVIKSAGNLELYKNCTWLIERHEKKGLGYSEKELLSAMKPFKGKLVGERAWTTHYIFRI